MVYFRIVFAVVILIFTAFNLGNTASNIAFKVDRPKDPDLSLMVDKTLPSILKACPGLNKYASDFTQAEVKKGMMRGYEGGFVLEFIVSDEPRLLPSPLNARSRGHHCFINVNAAGDKAYIPKTSCHSMCRGKLQEDDPGLMGKEYRLKAQ